MVIIYYILNTIWRQGTPGLGSGLAILAQTLFLLCCTQLVLLLFQDGCNSSSHHVLDSYLQSLQKVPLFQILKFLFGFWRKTLSTSSPEDIFLHPDPIGQKWVTFPFLDWDTHTIFNKNFPVSLHVVSRIHRSRQMQLDFNAIIQI